MNDLDLSPNLSENEELDDNNNNGGNLSDVSLSSSPEINQQDDLPTELHNQIDEVLHINENEEEENDLIRFIKKAREQDFNCLDLSKKNIIQFPSTLLEFPSLQVN